MEERRKMEGQERWERKGKGERERKREGENFFKVSTQHFIIGEFESYRHSYNLNANSGRSPATLIP